MVRRVHHYEDGGKVVKDHRVEAEKTASPGIGGAIKDFVGSLSKASAPKSVTQRKTKIDQAVEDASK